MIRITTTNKSDKIRKLKGFHGFVVGLINEFGWDYLKNTFC